VYERGCASITNSVDLWTEYCAFEMETTHRRVEGFLDSTKVRTCSVSFPWLIRFPVGHGEHRLHLAPFFTTFAKIGCANTLVCLPLPGVAKPTPIKRTSIFGNLSFGKKKAPAAEPTAVDPQPGSAVRGAGNNSHPMYVLSPPSSAHPLTTPPSRILTSSLNSGLWSG